MLFRHALIIALAASLVGLMLMGCSEPTDGKGIFKSEGCTNCHKFRGTGGGNISLDSVTEYRTDDWIRQQIHDSKVNDPNSGMPNFSHLSKSQVELLLKFLHSK